MPFIRPFRDDVNCLLRTTESAGASRGLPNHATKHNETAETVLPLLAQFCSTLLARLYPFYRQKTDNKRELSSASERAKVVAIMMELRSKH
jgi:hypothetical protein